MSFLTPEIEGVLEPLNSWEEERGGWIVGGGGGGYSMVTDSALQKVRWALPPSCLGPWDISECGPNPSSARR